MSQKCRIQMKNTLLPSFPMAVVPATLRTGSGTFVCTLDHALSLFKIEETLEKSERAASKESTRTGNIWNPVMPGS